MTIATITLSTIANAVYTSSGNNAITSLTLCNYSSGNVTANVFVVPSGQSPDTTNIMFSNLTLQPYDTYQIYQAAEKLLLGNGDTIRANSSANSSVTVVTSYTSI